MDLTDRKNNDEDNVVHQHDCIHVATSMKKETDPYQIISYCLTEWPSTWNIEDNNLDQKLTFSQLYKQNISSQQLYTWSVPMDVIEQYQFYRNQRSLSKNISLIEATLVYNCTLPRFGRYCQYSFDISSNESIDHLSLNDLISQYYEQEYDPLNLTCYIHLECNRGSSSMCLDWSEICDGIVDCHNGIDEEYCWQLESNECQDNEYRCKNGQCIPKIFSFDISSTFECLDRSDNVRSFNDMFVTELSISEPIFANEDILCPKRNVMPQVKLTSSCLVKRDQLLKKLLVFDKPNTISDDNCWLAVRCELQILRRSDPKCQDHCYDKPCQEIINETCPDMIKIPSSTFAYGHIFFLYDKQMIESDSLAPTSPHYICYNDQLCYGFLSSSRKISFDNATCRPPADFPLIFNNYAIARGNWYHMFISPVYQQLLQCNTVSSNISIICNNITMYKCLNSSKCIAKDRLCDTVYDCDHYDDEHCSLVNGSCLIYGLDYVFYCASRNICMSLTLINDGFANCPSIEHDFTDDEYSDLYNIRKHISFATICDGFTELLLIDVNGKNQTDETECDYWPCNNTYTRCDGFWNCFDGADEVDCDPSPIIECPLNHHACVSPTTNHFMCLPLKKADDSIIDCLGGTDEPKLCRSEDYRLNDRNFHCLTDYNGLCTSTRDLCYFSYCPDGSDQQFCDASNNRTLMLRICSNEYETIRSNVEKFFCTRPIDTNKPQIVHFSLDRSTNSIQNADTISVSPSMQEIISFPYQQVCHRGLPLRLWLNIAKNITSIVCLCPPSFYGNQCQYQNQRVSLTIRFQAYSDSRQTLFSITIFLIDDSDQRLIHSYQQLTYIYTHHCQTKFNMYLLYSQRPKLLTKNYSIHIDIYEKISLIYRGSLLIPLKFSFLPVHRVAVQLSIPRTNDTYKTCSDDQCVHGQCILYIDDEQERSFCKCNSEWTGKYCTIPYQCSCSSDPSCIGVDANNRSICVCPLHKWGSQCLLDKTICNSNQNTTCKNSGQCISLNENLILNQQFICLCRKGFSGKLCEIEDNKIVLSFDDQIQLPQTMLVYFIRIYDNAPPENGSTYKTISPDQKAITIRWSYPFHIVFVELYNNNTYYLVTVQKTYNQSSIMSKTIQPSDRCEYLGELLNETIVNYHLIRRIKYYHLACQRRTPLLSCFYDQTHFCLCNNFGNQRLANCFEFNVSIKHDCFGQSSCENSARCLQDRSNCPQTSICVCPKCFYGSRCQFNSYFFGLSLDGIIDSHLQTYTKMKDQPAIVQFSVGLSIILIVIGLVNGILLLITFKNKAVQKVGCGLYLLILSINDLIIVIIFTLKISIVLITQITYVTNRTFLNIQCYSIDFLLQSCLLLNQWLSACIAMERIFTIIKGVNFDKATSKKLAKYMISILIFVIPVTNIHDPIHRNLLYTNDNDIEENRIWCIVRYSNSLQIYNRFIHMVHFLIPFIINIISAITIILMTTRQRQTLETQQTYKKLLYEQFQQYKSLLIGPIILVIIGLPRLIIYFVSGCMKSTQDSWLFLIGYFMSLIPSIVTFLIFVLPSKVYKEVFQTAIKRYRQKIRF